jgi:REP element-mobilizing transposase RayT
MPNHFHFLVRVKDFSNLGAMPSLEGMASLIAEQFRRLFITYTQAINKQEIRHGSLFEKPFRKKLIDTPSYLFRVVRYIHTNPVHHKLISNIEDWPYSSYLKILDSRKSKLKKKDVLDFFNGRENYIEQHKRKENLDLIERFLIE